MQLIKSSIISLAIAVGQLVPGLAGAQDANTVRLVTPYPAGGPTDVVARTLARPLSEELGRSVVVDNRSGASGTIGAGHVARSSADANVLLINTSIQVILPHLPKLPYDTLADFTPIGQVNTIPFILVINKNLPFTNLADLIRYAKRNPGKLNYASNSSGSASHLAAEQFKAITGVSLVHIPYMGSAPAITDLIGGQVQLMFEQGPSISAYLKSGQLRALAVTSLKRSGFAPDVPTCTEEGVPFVYTNWQGIWAPPGLPAATTSRLTAALRNVMARPDVRQRLTELGTEPSTLVGDDFDAFVKQQYRAVGDIVRTANVKLD
jgi:tripartite-type tricarboxylate transporter receptor subunit TctC